MCKLYVRLPATKKVLGNRIHSFIVLFGPFVFQVPADISFIYLCRRTHTESRRSCKIMLLISFRFGSFVIVCAWLCAFPFLSSLFTHSLSYRTILCACGFCHFRPHNNVTILISLFRNVHLYNYSIVAHLIECALVYVCASGYSLKLIFMLWKQINDDNKFISYRFLSSVSPIKISVLDYSQSESDTQTDRVRNISYTMQLTKRKLITRNVCLCVCDVCSIQNPIYRFLFMCPLHFTYDYRLLLLTIVIQRRYI